MTIADRLLLLLRALISRNAEFSISCLQSPEIKPLGLY